MAELTARQREALEAGRKKRTANLAARRAGKALSRVRSHHATPRGSAREAAPAPSRAVAAPDPAILPPQVLTGSAPFLPDSSSLLDDDSARASDPEGDDQAPALDGTDALEFAFEYGAEGMPDAAGGEGDEGEPHGFAGLVKRFAGKLRGTEAPRPSRGPLSSQEDSEVSAAADELAPLAVAALMLALGWLVGDELAPSEQQAADMIAPLLRIWARHMPALRTISPDAADLLASAGALALYVQAIAPEVRRRHAERKLANARALRGANGSNTARILQHPANLAATAGADRAAASVATGTSDASAAPTPQRAEYRTESPSGGDGNDDAGVRYYGAAVADPERVLAEITGGRF